MEKVTNKNKVTAYDQYAAAVLGALAPLTSFQSNPSLIDANIKELEEKQRQSAVDLADDYAVRMLRKRQAFLDSLEPES